MPYSFQRPSISTLGLLAVLLSLLASQAYSYRQMAALKPAIIATVDIQSAITSSSAKSKIEAELKTLGEQFDAECSALKQKVEELKAEIDLYPAGSDQFRTASDSLMRAVFDYQSTAEKCKIKLESQRARALRNLYLDVKKAAQALAVQKNYDIVLVNDSLADFPSGTEEEVTRQIGARRILYSVNTIDVTEDLIQVLNSQ